MAFRLVPDLIWSTDYILNLPSIRKPVISTFLCFFVAKLWYILCLDPPKLLDTNEESIIVTKLESEVVLKCDATGVPLPLHIWYKNGIPVIDGKDRKYIGYDGSLILTQVGGWLFPGYLPGLIFANADLKNFCVD